MITFTPPAMHIIPITYSALVGVTKRSLLVQAKQVKMNCMFATIGLLVISGMVEVASQGIPPQAYPATVVSVSEGCPTDEQLEAAQTELFKEVRYSSNL